MMMNDNFIYKQQQLSPVLVIVIYLTRSSSMENYLLFLLIKTFTLSLVSIQSSNRKITFFYTQQHLPDENGETCMALEAHIRQSSAVLKEHSVLPCQEDEIKRLFARIDMLLHIFVHLSLHIKQFGDEIKTPEQVTPDAMLVLTKPGRVTSSWPPSIPRWRGAMPLSSLLRRPDHT